MKPRLPLLLMLLLLLSAPPIAMAQQQPCSAILDAHCQVCHSKARICNALGEKQKAEWQRTVKNMLKKGATLPASQEESLIDCLASSQAGAEFACKP